MLASALVFFVVIVDLFTDKVVTDYVFEGLVFLAMAGLGSVAVEAFARRRSSNRPHQPFMNETIEPPLEDEANTPKEI